MQGTFETGAKKGLDRRNAATEPDFQPTRCVERTCSRITRAIRSR
jgi:hypothetical protein